MGGRVLTHTYSLEDCFQTDDAADVIEPYISDPIFLLIEGNHISEGIFIFSHLVIKQI